MTQRHTARAVELLSKVMRCGLFDRARIAKELVVSEPQVDAYLDERAAMPLDRQLCIAQFVIERVPALARQGHRLRGQVRAAIAFSEHMTRTHADAPPLLYR